MTPRQNRISRRLRHSPRPAPRRERQVCLECTERYTSNRPAICDACQDAPAYGDPMAGYIARPPR